jgi:parallel beta-helix repeat protein
MGTLKRIGGLLGLGLLLFAIALVKPVAASPLAAAQTCQRTIHPGDDIRQVIRSLPDDGSHITVCLAPGVHRVSGMITIERSHLMLRSATDRATLQMAPGVSSPVLVIGDAHHREPAFRIVDVTIQGLRVEGGGPSEHEFHPDLPYLSNSAVVVRSGSGIHLRNLDVSGCRSACLLTEYGSRDVTIEGNTVHGAVWDGISLNRAGPTRVIGNVIRDNTAAGITVEYLEDSQILDNRIEGNGSHGIYLAHGMDNVFRDNAFIDNELAGVFLTCSIRHRDPVQCWPDSMSLGNVFANNRFEGNRHAYQIAVDDAANCLSPQGPVNVSRGDSFGHTPLVAQPPTERYGECLRIEAPELP